MYVSTILVMSYAVAEMEGRKNSLDFTLATDERSIRIHFEHLLGQRTVGALIGRSGHDHRQVEELTQLGMSHDVLLIQGGVPVAGNLKETDLQVEDQEKL
jgi:hypothetical protein